MSDWREQLSDELKPEPMFKDIPDVNTLAKVARDAVAFRGAAIRPPGPDAGPEAHAEFAKKLAEKAPGIVYMPQDEKAMAAVEESIWTRLGRPADENGYAATVEGVELDVAGLKAQAKAEGLTRAQFAKRLEKAVADARTGQEARKTAEAELRREWGPAYEEKVIQAKSAALRLGIPESALASIPPSQLKVWANVAKSIGGEGRQVADQPANNTGAPTREEMSLQVAEMRNRPEYLDSAKNPAMTAHLRRKVMEFERILSE